MTSTRENWLQRATAVLRALGGRPLLLLLTILAFNAVARPYRHFVHDARLYGFQVLNRLHDGAYNDDLFFRYGSQDSFSVFSSVVTPVVRVIGMDWAFFLLFLACNVLLLWSFQRLVRALIEDRVLSTLALLLLAVSPLPYGGFDIFHVHESFLTPRLLANAFVLFGLERAFQRRWTAAFLLQFAGCLVHPLMAVAGLFIVAVWWLGETIGWKKALILGGSFAVIGTVVLAIPSLAARIFGYMDVEWRTVVRHATPYNFPSEWLAADWVNVAASFAVMIGALSFLYYDDAKCATFLTVVCGFGIAGLLGTILASQMPYAILFQGQPYRAVWIVKFLEIPLAMWLVARMWRANVDLGYAGLVAFIVRFGLLSEFTPDVWMLALFLALAVLVYRLSALSKRKQWLWRSVIAGLVCSMAAWSIYLVVLVIRFHDRLLESVNGIVFVNLICRIIGPLSWVAFGIVLMSILQRKIGFGRAYAAVMTAALLIIPLGLFSLQTISAAQQWHDPDYRDVQFVQNFLQRQSKSEHPVIYSCLGNSKYVWLDWRVVSYFDRNQVSGVLFNRKTAVEGLRRAKLVRSFELTRLRARQDFLSDERAQYMFELFGADFSCPEPTVTDLVRIINEEVDYVVLKREFPGLYCATNGRVFIYERRYVTAKISAASGLALASAER